MRLGVLVPIGFAAGALLSWELLRYAPAKLAADRAQPLIVVTSWQHFGALMWLALFFAITIAGLGYVLLLRTLCVRPSSRAPQARCSGVLRQAQDDNPTALTMTMLCSALASAAALAFPVVFSSDVYAYAGYGWEALHAIDPYAHAHIALHDPLMNTVLWQWGNPPPVCVYGPAFVWFAQALVWMFGALGPAAPLWALRIAMCAALAGCAPLAYAAFAGFPVRTRLAATAGIALNPIAIWSCAEGHNDVFVVAIALAGFAFIARARPFAGALLLGFSPLVKLPGLLAAVAALLAYWNDRERFLRVTTGLILGAATSAVIAWPLLSEIRRSLMASGHYFPQFSFQYLLSMILADRAAIGITAVAACLCALGGCLLLAKQNLTGAPLLALALWIAIPNPYPWYALWILPVAFVAWETPAAWALVALTLCTVVRYYPDATADLSHGLSLTIAGLQLAVPVAIFIACSRRSRPDLPGNRTTGRRFATSRFP